VLAELAAMGARAHGERLQVVIIFLLHASLPTGHLNTGRKTKNPSSFRQDGFTHALAAFFCRPSVGPAAAPASCLSNRRRVEVTISDPGCQTTVLPRLRAKVGGQSAFSVETAA
jgi:hypothetical protein